MADPKTVDVPRPTRQQLCALETFQPNVADYVRSLEAHIASDAEVIAGLRKEVERLRKAHIIEYENGDRACRLCGDETCKDWQDGEPEKHVAGCLAAPQKGGGE